ncbi:hypothetical protein EGR_09677 [Echinococcus granulosus]|uniref:Uncharacterized protein n=1 Tax=Echinococcus granulosus TaxID=6210 RepID=W6UQ39_ECHGR|nr:hypothetical protein EGR_09677 [Echinococcus granulosus]EUB55469.1 hypothetical protein EGR_09677 [Echinococcus granulosus]
MARSRLLISVKERWPLSGVRSVIETHLEALWLNFKLHEDSAQCETFTRGLSSPLPYLLTPSTLGRDEMEDAAVQQTTLELLKILATSHLGNLYRAFVQQPGFLAMSAAL